MRPKNLIYEERYMPSTMRKIKWLWHASEGCKPKFSANCQSIKTSCSKAMLKKTCPKTMAETYSHKHI